MDPKTNARIIFGGHMSDRRQIEECLKELQLLAKKAKVHEKEAEKYAKLIRYAHADEIRKMEEYSNKHTVWVVLGFAVVVVMLSAFVVIYTTSCH